VDLRLSIALLRPSPADRIRVAGRQQEARVARKKIKRKATRNPIAGNAWKLNKRSVIGPKHRELRERASRREGLEDE